MTQNNVKRFKCAWANCGKSFKRNSDLCRHRRIHTNERPYHCPVDGCNKNFIQRSALTVHVRTHSGERPYVCGFGMCSKAFTDTSSLARHRRSHTGIKPYKCPEHLCNKSFSRKATLVNHQLHHHVPEWEENAIHGHLNFSPLPSQFIMPAPLPNVPNEILQAPSDLGQPSGVNYGLYLPQTHLPSYLTTGLEMSDQSNIAAMSLLQMQLTQKSMQLSTQQNGWNCVGSPMSGLYWPVITRKLLCPCMEDGYLSSNK